MQATNAPAVPLTISLLALDTRLASAQRSIQIALELVCEGNAYGAGRYIATAKRLCGQVSQAADALPVGYGRVSNKALDMHAHSSRILQEAMYLEKG